MKEFPPLLFFSKPKYFGCKKSIKFIITGLVGLTTSSGFSQGDILVIHDLIAATTGGSGTDITFLGSNVNINASVVSGGTGLPAATHGVSEANSWGADPTDNIPWDNAAGLALRSNSTRLEGLKELVDDGVNGNYQDFIGFHITFSNPIPLYDFYVTDVDGGEWSLSFAMNGTSPVLPSVTLGSNLAIQTVSTNTLAASSYDTAISYTSGSATTPSTVNIVQDLDNNGNVDIPPTDGQAKYSYNGQLVTDLVFSWGLHFDRNDAAIQNNQRSGVSGFSIIEPANVPEPSAALLGALSSLLFLGRRYRVFKRQKS